MTEQEKRDLQKIAWTEAIDTAVINKDYDKMYKLLNGWKRRVIKSSYWIFQASINRPNWADFTDDMNLILDEKIAYCLLKWDPNRGHFRNLLNASLKGLQNTYMREIGLGKKSAPMIAPNTEADSRADRKLSQSLTDWIYSLDATDRIIFDKLKNIGRKTGRKKYGVNWLWENHFNNLTREDFRNRYDRLHDGYKAIAC